MGMTARHRGYEAVVIGAGPAGSTVAALLAEAGHRVLLVERAAMPRVHVGESLMPETYWIFKRLGILQQLKDSSFVRKVGVQFVGPSGKHSQPFHFLSHDSRECSQTWHVDRAQFDHLLFRNAAAKGAECLDQTRAVDVQTETSQSVVTLQDGTGTRTAVSARVLVDASGQQAFLANRMGLRVMNPELRKAAIWGHFFGAERTGAESAEITSILHTAGKEAWFWYIPLAANKVSVGLVGDHDYLLKSTMKPADTFYRHVAEHVVMRSRLESARVVEGLHVSREFSYSTRQRSGDGWVLVGDACGFIDPVYSTGVLLALRSGELAADAIHQGLALGDLSGGRLAQWVPDFELAVDRFRRLVRAFYADHFSFARFLRKYPDYQGRLTDLLIGRAHEDGMEQLVNDLDMAVAQACDMDSGPA